MSIVLGTGIPMIRTYIITSAMVAPALLQLGGPLIVSHMFVFYFGIMADLTPTVALWRYHPHLPPLPELRLTLSPYTTDYRLCRNGQCQNLASLLSAKAETAVVTVRPCSTSPRS